MGSKIRMAGQIMVIISGIFIALSFFSKKASAGLPAITRLDNLFGVAAVGKDHAWVVGYKGKIFHTPDAGKTWELQESGTKYALYSVKFIDEHKGLITGQYGTILSTEDGGKNWRKVNSGSRNHLFSLCYADDQQVWAVGNWGTIIYSPDGGKSWQDKSLSTWGKEELDRFLRRDENPDIVLNQVYFYDPLNGWMIGEFAHILYTADGGVTWEPRENFVDDIPLNTYLFDIAFQDAQHGCIVGLAGASLYTDDGGQSWKKATTNTIQNVLTVGIGKKCPFAFGSVGVALQLSHNPGNGWKNIGDINTINWLREVSFSADGEMGWLVGGSGSIYKTRDGGESWQDLSPIRQ